MSGVILFGTGSPVLLDVDESLHRAGLRVEAGVRNRPGICYLPDDLRHLTTDDLDPSLKAVPFLVPLFTPAHRHTAAREAAAAGFGEAFTLIDPSVAAPRRLDLGPGSYVNAGCSLGGSSRFGIFTFINRGASIGHHAQFGDFVSVGPGVVIAGQVRVATGAVIGAGATILPERSIGRNAVVGAGSVVTRDVPDGCVVLGNPARIVRRDIGGYKGLPVP
ncbi:acetyltransferase [Methylobacterium sp. WL9]|uniref:acetyltransferase n=1 Tax=Methylobacterium sp. WL9 TaxID=2603898 RepID=UPI0011CC0C55|nr:acetyltransferase [Methylobacterium sp. WL9]TXN22705.1 acetyltransferase [Methylobacterium sp. WL9]